MFSVLLFSAIVASAFSGDITRNTAPDFIGDFKLVFVYPKPSEDVPTGVHATYSHLEFTDVLENMSCECGRKDANVVLLQQKTRFVSQPILFDIVNSVDQVPRALGDSCECQPFTFKRAVALKLNDNMMVQYEQNEKLTYFVFAKVVPSQSELREAVSHLKGVKYENGMLLIEK